MTFPSKLIEDAVNEFARLPGIGRKTALRLVLHLMKMEKEQVRQFGDTVIRMRDQIKFCSICKNVSDEEQCAICQDHNREHSSVCVVETIRDVMAIESTGQFRGLYHVLGGVISPVDGIGPETLNIDALIARTADGQVKELIMALNPTMEGDTTIFYISKRLKDHDVRITTIARGVAFGGELEYTDEQTLARSIATRMPYENYLVNR